MSKSESTLETLTDAALDAAAGGTKAHPGGVNILLADGSVRGATSTPKDGPVTDGTLKPVIQSGSGNGI